MTSESERSALRPERPRPLVVAVEDEALRDQLAELLDGEQMDFEVVDPAVDPLRDPPEKVADLLVVRRSSVRPQDLRAVEDYARRRSNPGLVVVTDGADDFERARLLSAGASGVLETDGPDHELRDTVTAIAGAERSLLRDPHAGREDSEPRLVDFLSRSPHMRRFLETVERVVDTNTSLLITGETGVGKERLAQAIHNEGPRAEGPFVSVNCGAIPEQLLESELFGHEEGAFTGANRRKKGRFELADGGTIFLDEIGEMPLHLQVNLLSVLQRRSVRRVGGHEPIPVDVRVMAATYRDVEAEVAGGRFREDLYYRLNVVTLHIPPLRERPEDLLDMIGSFVGHFRKALGRAQVTSICDDALRAMIGYDWPGNVRQLVNAIEHAVVMCRGASIGLEDLPEAVRRAAGGGRPAVATGAGGARRSDVERWLEHPLREARREVALEFERDYLDALLQRTQGRVGRTAELAGITPRSLYDKLKRHELRKEDYR